MKTDRRTKLWDGVRPAAWEFQANEGGRRPRFVRNIVNSEIAAINQRFGVLVRLDLLKEGRG